MKAANQKQKAEIGKQPRPCWLQDLLKLYEGNDRLAALWLTAPHFQLQGSSPLATIFIDGAKGEETVAKIIDQLTSGAYA
jgi:uncharacterized protein (DUF2384 family)